MGEWSVLRYLKQRFRQCLFVAGKQHGLVKWFCPKGRYGLIRYVVFCFMSARLCLKVIFSVATATPPIFSFTRLVTFYWQHCICLKKLSCSSRLLFVGICSLDEILCNSTQLRVTRYMNMMYDVMLFVPIQCLRLIRDFAQSMLFVKLYKHLSITSLWSRSPTVFITSTVQYCFTVFYLTESERTLQLKHWEHRVPNVPNSSPTLSARK